MADGNSSKDDITAFCMSNWTSNRYQNSSIIGEDTYEVNRIGRIILLVMFASNIFGNTSVLIVMWGTARKKRMRFFIMNLAITDLFVAMAGIFPELLLNITVHFYAPGAICKLVKYMSSTATYASSFALVVLSFDRAEAVINPLRSAKQTCCGVLKPKYLAICGWGAACVCGIPGFLLAYVLETPLCPACFLDFSYISPRVYLTSVAVTVFILPAFFITLCHAAMVARIWQAAASNNQKTAVAAASASGASLREAFGQHNTQPAKFGCLGVNPSRAVELSESLSNLEQEHEMELKLESDALPHVRSPNIPSCKNPVIIHDNVSNANPHVNQPPKRKGANFVMFNSNTGCIPRARVKTVKMTLVIVSVYIMCWCPYMIWNLIVTFGLLDKRTPNFKKISPLIQHLVTLNSSANPLIFWVFSAHTILSERRRNRRSKVVQRHHTRWSYGWRNAVLHRQGKPSDETRIGLRQTHALQNNSNSELTKVSYEQIPAQLGTT